MKTIKRDGYRRIVSAGIVIGILLLGVIWLDASVFEASAQTAKATKTGARECTINHCQARAINDGQFCLGHDLADSDQPLSTLIVCALDENGCRAEASREECEYGCDPETSACITTPPGVHITGTVSRPEVLQSIVEGGVQATSFVGDLAILIYAEPRNAGEKPSASPVADAEIMGIDLTRAQTAVPFDGVIDYAGDAESLASGTYYADVFLHVGEYNENESLEDGDLMTFTQVAVTIAAGETIELGAVVLDRVFDDAVIEER